MSCLTVCYMPEYQDISIIEAKNEQPVHAIINFIFVFPHVTYQFSHRMTQQRPLNGRRNTSFTH